MRILAAIQALIAAAFLLMGLVLLVSIGITGLILLVSGGVFAATAGAASTGSRGGVLLALAVDAALAAYAVTTLGTSSISDFAMPAITIAVVSVAFLAVLLDWRSVVASKWLEGRGL